MKHTKHRTYHYVDASGIYIGGFGDGATPPEGAIKVPAPKHGKDVWDGEKWTRYVRPSQNVPDLKAAVQAIISGDMIAAQTAMDKME